MQFKQVTRAEAYSATFEWTIEGFSKLPHVYQQDSLTSKEIKVGSHPVCLLMYPGGGGGELDAKAQERAKEFTAMYVTNKSASKEIVLDVSLSIRNGRDDSTTLQMNRLVNEHFKAGKAWGYSLAFNRSVLVSLAAGNKDCLVVTASFTLHESQEDITRIDCDSQRLMRFETYACDMSTLLKDTPSDVTFCVGHRKFPAQRAVLSARSPVFKAMFRSAMSESKEGNVVIEDIHPTAFAQLLHFVYHGDLAPIQPAKAEPPAASAPDSKRTPSSIGPAKVESKQSPGTLSAMTSWFARFSGSWAETVRLKRTSKGKVKAKAPPPLSEEAMFAQLLMAAHRYEIGSLAETCALKLATYMSVANVAEMLQMAYQFNLSSLQTHCWAFMFHDGHKRMSAIKETDGFKVLSKDLMHEVLERMLTPSKPQVVASSTA